MVLFIGHVIPSLKCQNLRENKLRKIKQKELQGKFAIIKAAMLLMTTKAHCVILLLKAIFFQKNQLIRIGKQSLKILIRTEKQKLITG